VIGRREGSHVRGDGIRPLLEQHFEILVPYLPQRAPHQAESLRTGTHGEEGLSQSRISARTSRVRSLSISSVGFTETFRVPTHGEPVHVDLALDGYKIGIASVASTRDDHGLDPVAEGQRAAASSGPTTPPRPSPR
jgi:hypothetical protein